MIVNLKSAREIKPKLNKGKMILNSAKISSLNSRNQSNTKYSKTNKIIKSNSSKEKIKKTKKAILNNNNKNNNKSHLKILLKAEKKMILNLKKYNVTIDSYNKKIITDIIYDERKHIVSEFKNYLLWDERSDFLKRFYYKYESKNRLPKINHYYEKYTLFPPVYFNLDDVVKIMLKNVKRKKKYLEMIEENEDNMYNNNSKKKENKDFNQIINPSDITQTMSLKTFKNNTLTNTLSSLNVDNESSSKDLGQLINKFVNENDNEMSYFDDEILKKAKNNSHEINNNNLNNINKSFFNINDSEIEKKNYRVTNENNENLEKKIDKNNKTKLPMTGKILEIKKLNFQNLNNNNNDNIDLKENKNMEQYKKNNNSDRQKKSNCTISNLTNIKNSNIKKNIKTNFPNNLLFTQKLLSTTRESKKKNNNNEKSNKSIENLLKIIQYPKQISPRTKTNNNTQNKVIKHKRKTNLVIQTNSKNTISSRINTSHNKKENKSNSNIENNKHSKQKYINNKIMTTPNFITNNNITSSIYNINLNLNLGQSTNKKNLTHNFNSNLVKQNKNHKNKYNIRNIIGNSSIPISNNQNSQFSNLFKPKNINVEQKKTTEIKRKDNKISYDLNTNGNNVHISIHKQTSSNNNNNNINNSNNQPSLNININCNQNNNLIEKKLSRNDKTVLSNLQSNSIKGKNLVIALGDNNNLKKGKNKSKKFSHLNDNYLINALYHETSMSIGKLKQKLNIQINKKYPLTSRNEKDIPYNIINKILKKMN